MKIIKIIIILIVLLLPINIQASEFNSNIMFGIEPIGLNPTSLINVPSVVGHPFYINYASGFHAYGIEYGSMDFELDSFFNKEKNFKGSYTHQALTYQYFVWENSFNIGADLVQRSWKGEATVPIKDVFGDNTQTSVYSQFSTTATLLILSIGNNMNIRDWLNIGFKWMSYPIILDESYTYRTDMKNNPEISFINSDAKDLSSDLNKVSASLGVLVFRIGIIF